jgi:radical SAM superfamily enzyme YgiQ (UPF0313 family)
MKPLKIYLADLTYDTVAISTESAPLNVGYIASYCLKRFGSDIEIKIFKYVDKLEKAIRESPPHILGMSNYVWNYNLGTEILRQMKKINPKTITVKGGPNFPADFPSQEQFMKEHPELDFYVPIEGEIGFSNIVEAVLNMDPEIYPAFENPVENCVSLKDGKLKYVISSSRINKLDEIPSPYTTGLLDEFFDGKLAPMLQTNRGCPFTCTFCTDGSDEVMKVNRFDPERVRADLNYIAKHVPDNTHTLYISDLNFGMLPDDLKTCDAIVEIQKKYDFPHKILSTTGKNNKEQIIESINRLNGTMALSMSVQSMDTNVLANIRRENISTEKMMELAPTIRKYNIRTTSEIIMGLPGETYQSHIDGIKELIKAGMDYIVIHSCMLLLGSEMAIPKERKKWNYKTKFRIIPRDFVKLRNGKNICEIEEIVVGSNVMSFEENLELRRLGFVLWVTIQGIVYDAIIKFLREQKVDLFELFYRMTKNPELAPKNIQEVFKRFGTAAVNELYDSPEQIIEKIQNEKEYEKLLEGEGAINVIQFHHALVLTEFMDDWTEYVIQISSRLLNEERSDEKTLSQFEEIANYCRGVSHNPLQENRMLTNPEFTFVYDIQNWLDGTHGMKLTNFKFNHPKKILFTYTKDQNKVINDNLDFYGNNLIGKTKALKSIPFQQLWRRPTGIENPSTSENIREIETKRWNTL